MAVKTFTSERLTSSDVNTYLTNSGLVWIKEQTIGSGVASISVTSAFSATYDAYKVILSGSTSTNNGDIRLALNGLTTGYYGNLIYANFVGGAPVSSGTNNLAYISQAGATDNGSAYVNCDIINPFLARQTFFQSSLIDPNNCGRATFKQISNTSATGFTITIASGTISGGYVRVYGYRQA